MNKNINDDELKKYETWKRERKGRKAYNKRYYRQNADRLKKAASKYYYENREMILKKEKESNRLYNEMYKKENNE